MVGLLNLPFQRRRHIAELLYSVRQHWTFTGVLVMAYNSTHNGSTTAKIIIEH